MILKMGARQLMLSARDAPGEAVSIAARIIPDAAEPVEQRIPYPFTAST